MGRNLGDLKIIDFFGLPGSGKSTIAQLAVSSLEKRGYSVDSHPINTGNTIGSARRMAIKLVATLVFSLLHFNFLYRLFKSLGKAPFRSLNEAIKQWINICYVLSEYNKPSKNKQIRIFDQGLAQAAISLTTNCKKTKAEDVLNVLMKKVQFSPYFVYIQADAETVLNRLKQRKVGRTRVLEYTNDDFEQKKLLKQIEISCEDILNHSTKRLGKFFNGENSSTEEICKNIVCESLLMMEEYNDYKRSGINYYSNP